MAQVVDHGVVAAWYSPGMGTGGKAVLNRSDNAQLVREGSIPSTASNTLTPRTMEYTTRFKEFRIARLSINANSFGLHHAVLVARDGQAFEAHPSKFGLGDKTQGSVVKVRCKVNDVGEPDLSSLGWEMCYFLPDAPQAGANERWKDQPQHA